jgi:hypothetical protein
MGVFTDFSLFIDTSFGSMDMSHVGLSIVASGAQC